MCIANENPFANYNLYRLDPPDSWPMDGCLETTSSPLVSSSPVDSGPIIIPQINQVALNKSNFNPSTVLFWWLIWSLPKKLGTPSHHPLWDFPYKPSSYWGTPMAMETAILSSTALAQAPPRRSAGCASTPWRPPAGRWLLPDPAPGRGFWSLPNPSWQGQGQSAGRG